MNNNSLAADKTLFVWINSKGGKVTARQVKPLPPSILILLSSWLFTPGANGSRYLRAEKALLAIRLRSKAYRLAGVRNSLDAALGDLLAILGEELAPTPPRAVAPTLKPRASLPAPRKMRP